MLFKFVVGGSSCWGGGWDLGGLGRGFRLGSYIGVGAT